MTKKDRGLEQGLTGKRVMIQRSRTVAKEIFGAISKPEMTVILHRMFF